MSITNDRYYLNAYSELDDNVENDYLVDKQKFSPTLLSNVSELINTLFTRINGSVSDIQNNNDYSIYTGYCGIAYLHYFNYNRFKDLASLEKAKFLTDKALTKLNGKSISFLLGDAGPLALGAVIGFKRNRDSQPQMLIERLIKLPETVKDFPDEILFGRAGYIYALMFVNKRLKNVIPETHIRNQLNELLESGKTRANETNFPCPLHYEWHSSNYLGAAHGLAGILYILLLNKSLLTKNEIHSLIKPTLDWLTATRFRDGNFPASADDRTNKLVQWCHGAPGFVSLYILASKVFEENKYLQIAVKCGEVTWNRGLLRKGYSICHGVSGNAYVFANLYQKTGDPKYLHRLACFLHWCTTYNMYEEMKPDRPLSMFEGISGLTYFLIDVQAPQTAAFPCYELN